MSDRAALIEIRRTDDPDQSFGYHSRVSVAHKFVCITVPKIACSRIKLTLHLLEGHDAPENVSHVHDLGKSLADFETSQIDEMLTSANWFRFCFVRNPYDRLISAYNTQVGNTWNQQYAWLKQEIKEAFGYAATEVPPEQLVSFRDFVRYFRDARDDVQRDGHFNVQTRILMPDLIDYDFVGRFERFADDFEHVLRHLGAPPEIVATVGQVINPTYRVQPALVYDKELADMAYEMYKPDFENYEYDRNSWMFERPGWFIFQSKQGNTL